MRVSAVSSGVLPFLSRPRPLAWAVFAFLLLPSLARAAPLPVPSAAYPTIQAAVNAAANGDTVLVAAGTYSGAGNRDIDFNGKSLTVTSSAGAASTVIDCQGSGDDNHRGFYIHNGETAAVVIGLTIKNGYESNVNNVGLGGTGAGIEIDDSSVTVQNCTIINNTGTGYNGGAGVNIFNSAKAGSVTLTNCNISGNKGAEAGGVFIDNAYVNGSTTNGSTATLTHCTISGNLGGHGGGVSSEGQATLVDCTISGNSAGEGGGVFNYSVDGDTITLTNCVITGNTGRYGGGVSNNNSSGGTITMTNCTITDNTAWPNNEGGGYGGGVYNSNDDGISTSIILTNNIVYGNTANNGGQTYSESGASPSVTYSDILGGYAGTGNINVNPKFMNAAYDDLRLKPGSPCFGVGTPNGAPATDIDGYPRPNLPSIGAYDVENALLYDGGYYAAHTDLSDATIGGVDLTKLASDTQVCKGAVADGATKVLLRYSANAAGSVTFTETNGVNGDKLRMVTSTQAPNNVPTQMINGKNVAFAVYTVPESLDGTPEALTSPNHFTQHTVNLQVVFTPSGGIAAPAVSAPLVLETPPALLIHGLWSDQNTWINQAGTLKELDAAGFNALNQNVFLVDYHNTNNLSLATNQLVPLAGIDQVCNSYRARQVAVTRVDVVGHSLGGLITRNFANWDHYKNKNNFQQGYIRRMITVGTPHYGSPIATTLTQIVNGSYGNAAGFFLSSLGSPYGAALLDLQPGSAALTQLKQQPIPCFAEVGWYNANILPTDKLQGVIYLLKFFGLNLTGIFSGHLLPYTFSN